MITQAPKSTSNEPHGPSRQTIEQERREQFAAVIALRRMLAKTPGTGELIVTTAA